MESVERIVYKVELNDEGDYVCGINTAYDYFKIEMLLDLVETIRQHLNILLKERNVINESSNYN